jgi:signal transduction histidine kinase
MFLLAHCGLFLMWQPLVHGGYRFGPRGLLALLAIVLGVALEASWGMLTVWLMVLASLVAGGAFLESLAVARWTYRLAVGYLILALALLVWPQVLPDAAAEVAGLWRLRVFGLPLLLVVLAALPVPRGLIRPVGAFDLLSALLVFLVLAVMLLGTVAFMELGGQAYLAGMVLTAFTLGGALLLLTWVWNPHLGGEGLALKLSRRVLAAGVSFDDWLHDVAQLALAEQEPLTFLSRAGTTLMRFPGVTGGRGEADGQPFEFGMADGADFPLEHGGLRLRLAFRQAPSAALLWYLSLALQVLHEFYREKVLARRLQTLSYLEAVHQTGARLTHDVKNLLQSLETLCFAASQPGASAVQIQALVQRQLPVVAQRLHQTLEKLRQPGLPDATRVPLAQWWTEARARHQAVPVEFVTKGGIPVHDVPAAVFHGVVDNLIQNALDKRSLAPALCIRVTLACCPEATVEVEDDGEPVPSGLAVDLFREPVRSENGFGMGLYQSAMLAAQAGYRLTLAENRRGRVCFRLAQEAPAARG